MKRQILSLLSFVFLASVFVSLAGADTKPLSGRVSLFGQAASTTYAPGDQRFFSDLVLTLTLRSTETGKDGYEYGIDVRGAGYPSTPDRTQRLSIYDAYAGAKFGQGMFAFRLGQSWLTELGSLGSLGGGLFEIRPRKSASLGQFRIGAFFGYEPKILEAGYVPGITKFGGYLALDGENARRSVLGFVTLRDSGLTERSVLVFNNYLPIGRTFYLYQAAEYDLLGPAGQGSGELTYFFANARYSPLSALELQGTYHRGHSFDTRTLTEDRLNGLPLDPRSLEGYLFESLGGRATVNITREIRLFAGFSQDRTNLGDGRSDRLTFGAYATNLFKTGLDLNISDWRMTSQSGSSYDSWYGSVGRNFGRGLYLEGFFSSSVSVLRFTESGGYRIDSYPRTRSFGISSVLNLFRTASVLITIERSLGNDFSEYRYLTGVSYRF